MLTEERNYYKPFQYNWAYEAYKRAEVVSDEKLRDFIFDDEDSCLACEG